MAAEPKKGFSASAALAISRAAKRVAEKYQDKGLSKAADGLEARAQDAIARQQPALDPLN